MIFINKVLLNISLHIIALFKPIRGPPLVDVILDNVIV